MASNLPDWTLRMDSSRSHQVRGASPQSGSYGAPFGTDMCNSRFVETCKLFVIAQFQCHGAEATRRLSRSASSEPMTDAQFARLDARG